MLHAGCALQYAVFESGMRRLMRWVAVPCVGRSRRNAVIASIRVAGKHTDEAGDQHRPALSFYAW